MTSWIRIILVLVCLCVPLISGCSSDKDKNEKSAIRKQTDQVAERAVKMIKTPKDRARAAVKAQEDYDKKVKEKAAE